MNLPKTFLFLFLLLLLSTCKRENMCDCIKRTGTIETETRVVGFFENIVVEQNLNVFITQDTVCEVKIEAGKNIIPLIETELDGTTLHLRNKNRCNFSRSYDKPFNVYLKMKTISRIYSNGTGNIKSSNTLTSNNFNVYVQNSGDVELTVNNFQVFSSVFGSGDLILHGSTTSHNCDIGGTAYLNCKDFQTQNTYVHSFTTGICYVNASDWFGCKLNQIGDVYCYGHPALTDIVKTNKGEVYFP